MTTALNAHPVTQWPVPQLHVTQLPDGELAATDPNDKDMTEQANPGHGIPSQDLDSAAQVGFAPQEASREANSVLAGGGLVAGAATGAAIGVAVAGPVGIVVGATLGAVVGAAGGAVAGSLATPNQPAALKR